MRNGQKISAETLNNLPLFSELTAQQSERIISISKIINYNKNEIIFMESDPYKGFYILLKGTIKIYKISFEGKE